MAIRVLPKKPSEDTKHLREWAINIINHHSDIRLSVKASEELKTRVFLEQQGICDPVIDHGTGKLTSHCGPVINQEKLKAINEKLKSLPNNSIKPTQ